MAVLDRILPAHFVYYPRTSYITRSLLFSGVSFPGHFGSTGLQVVLLQVVLLQVVLLQVVFADRFTGLTASAQVLRPVPRSYGQCR